MMFTGSEARLNSGSLFKTNPCLAFFLLIIPDIGFKKFEF